MLACIQCFINKCGKYIMRELYINENSLEVEQNIKQTIPVGCTKKYLE